MHESKASPLMKSLSRRISSDELAMVSGAGTKVIINMMASTEETYRKGSETPEQLDTIIETP